MSRFIHKIQMRLKRRSRHFDVTEDQTDTLYVLDTEAATDRVNDNQVSLQKIATEPTNGRLIGRVQVHNITYDKQVFVRYTSDDWASHTDAEATFSHAATPDIDEFTFGLEVDPKRPVKLAVCYRCENGEFWDNNQGDDYCYTLVTKRSPKRKDQGGVVENGVENGVEEEQVGEVEEGVPSPPPTPEPVPAAVDETKQVVEVKQDEEPKEIEEPKPTDEPKRTQIDESNAVTDLDDVADSGVGTLDRAEAANGVVNSSVRLKKGVKGYGSFKGSLSKAYRKYIKHSKEKTKDGKEDVVMENGVEEVVVEGKDN